MNHLLFLEGVTGFGWFLIIAIPLMVVYLLGYYKGKDAGRKEEKKGN